MCGKDDAVMIAWRRVSICVVVAAAWYERGLWQIWWHSPYDQGGLPAMLLWCVLLRVVWSAGPWRPIVPLVAAGMVIAALGAMTSLHVAVQAGVVLVLAGQCRARHPAMVLVVAAAASWMPATGWFAARVLPPEWITALRVLPITLVLFLLMARARQWRDTPD